MKHYLNEIVFTVSIQFKQLLLWPEGYNKIENEMLRDTIVLLRLPTELHVRSLDTPNHITVKVIDSLKCYKGISQGG